MRWEDESYVRVYTRDTPELCLLSWQARAILWELLRKADRAGIVAMGKSGTRALAAMIRMPLAVVDEHLPELLADGCLVRSSDDQALVLPNYVSAQEAKQSDRLRKQEQRSRDRARALAPQPVTNRDHESQDVTNSHTRSHAVTRGHSELSRAEHSSADQIPPLVPPQGEAQGFALTPSEPAGEPSRAKAKSARGAMASRRRPETELPEDWKPTDAHGAKAKELRVDLETEAERFRNHARAHGRLARDWGAAFSNWLLKAPEMRQPARRGGTASSLQPEAGPGQYDWKTEHPEEVF